MLKLKTKYILCRNATILLSILSTLLIFYIVLEDTNDKKLINKLRNMYTNDISIKETNDNVTIISNGETITIQKIKE